MRPVPKGWPRISSAVVYQHPAEMIDWLCRAFGFVLRLKVDADDGSIANSELTYGEGVIMVSGPKPADRFGMRLDSPQSLHAATQTMMVYVDGLDEHCARARAAGARITSEPALHDYGETYWADRSYGALDPEGHPWWFTQRVRDPA